MLANKGEFERARSELETALRLMPGSFAILVAYLSWASAFGEPALGAELADRAVRLNPHFQPWASGGLRYAYFMAARYEDALKVMDRQTPENYSKYAWVERAGSLAALGRSAEARQTVTDALHFYPELTIELIANDPAFNATEQERHVETMRLAGFPACAKPGQLDGVKSSGAWPSARRYGQSRGASPPSKVRPLIPSGFAPIMLAVQLRSAPPPAALRGRDQAHSLLEAIDQGRERPPT